MPERQLPLPHGLSSVEQGLPDVLTRQVRMLCQNLLDRHLIGDHRDHRSHGEPKTSDTRQATHDIRVSRDPLERHTVMLRAQETSYRHAA